VCLIFITAVAILGCYEYTYSMGGWPGVVNLGIPGFGEDMIDISNDQDLPKDMNVLYKE
jgi:hypothetical protein